MNLKKPSLFIITLFLFASIALAVSYKDVPANHWAAEAVNKLSDLGVITGMPDGTFQGNQSVTRYQLAVSLYRLFNIVSDRISSVDRKISTGTTSTVSSSQVPANIDAQLRSLSDQIVSVANMNKTLSTKVDSLTQRVDSIDKT
ncbi:MAG: S-layer homology domain-containing protein, partial [Fervidobacterium sp.]